MVNKGSTASLLLFSPLEISDWLQSYTDWEAQSEWALSKDTEKGQVCAILLILFFQYSYYYDFRMEVCHCYLNKHPVIWASISSIPVVAWEKRSCGEILC